MPMRAIVLAILLHPLLVCAAGGDVLRLGPDGAGEELPTLPGEARANDWALDLARSGAGLAYADNVETWDARLDGVAGSTPSLRLAHALRLSDRLGAGTKLSRDADSSELMVSAVYAHKRNMRLRFALGQRRSTPAADGGLPFEQQSYLLGAKKYWNDKPWTDAGVSLFAIDARNTSADWAEATDGEHLSDTVADEAMRGSTRGIALKLGLRPLPRSRLELHHEYKYTSSYYTDRTEYSQANRQSRVAWSQAFGNCMQFAGGYSGGADSGQVEVRLSRQNWSLRLARNVGGDEASSFLFGYSLPLDGRSSGGGTACASAPARQSFEPLMAAAVQRPDQFGYAPIMEAP